MASGRTTAIILGLIIVLTILTGIQNSADLRFWYQGTPQSTQRQTKTQDYNTTLRVKYETTKHLSFPQSPSSLTLTPTSITLNKTHPAIPGSLGDCTPSPNQALTKVLSFPQYENSSIYYNINNNDLNGRRMNFSDVVAVAHCRLHPVGASHFPHVMQQLYGCYSYWQDTTVQQNNLQRNNTTPVLLILSIPPKMEMKMERNPFLKGFMEVLTTQLGVQVVVGGDEEHLVMGAIQQRYRYTNDSMEDEINETDANTTPAILAQEFDMSGGYILSHVQILNQLVQQHIHPNVTTPQDMNHLDSNTCYRNGTTTSFYEIVPKLGILNRKSSNGRFLSNANAIKDTLEETLSRNFSRVPSVSIYYFEERNFQEQVTFFRDVDIVISPHGAQLTGIPFLANQPCCQLLELFPKRYWIPSFFGSLARNAGVGYSYLYLSENLPELEQASSLQERVRARAQSLCPSPKTIVTAVQELVRDWQQCCHAKS